MTIEAYEYGYPDEIRFCKKCVMPNTKPVARNEYKHVAGQKPKYMLFDETGVCSACRFSEAKWNQKIDWQAREEELKALLARYRSKDGSYDCIVPGSGGKDSGFASHLLKSKYGMHPLTVTWSPHLYTDIGWQNFQDWIHVGGFDNFLFTPNGKIHRLLTRNAFMNLMHPFQPFIMGQKTFAAKMAARFGIPLVFYGENPGEYGANISFEQKTFGFDRGGAKAPSEREGHRLDFVTRDMGADDIFLGGRPVAQYIKDDGLEAGDLAPYMPLDPSVVEAQGIAVHFLGYYVKWVSQEAYYYAVENTGFHANPVRTEGTYSKYSSLDDKIDGFFYYSTFVKYGFGRATQDASQEIRNHHITRDEAVALVKKFDGEYPNRYYRDILEYLSLNDEEFRATFDRFRSPKLWEKSGDEWSLRHAVWKESA
jgi:N-acetyl sugar amidotransferase